MRRALVALSLAVVAIAVAGCSSPVPVTVQQSSQAMHPSGPPPEGTRIALPLRSPGGPFLYDADHRVVLLHGVNLVDKHPPFVLNVHATGPEGFGLDDAERIAHQGFDAVRLGVTWSGIEPGHGGSNQPGVCTPGTPGNPGMWDHATAERYAERVKSVVSILGRAGLMVIIDMHQDVYNEAFGGEGAPAWAVCTDGPIVIPPGRWSNAYGSASLASALGHFWRNDVIGNLQGNYDHAWSFLAGALKDEPTLIGYDPFNEPFSTAYRLEDRRRFATALECAYTGRATPGRLDTDARPLSCPPTTPLEGIIPSIEHADGAHLVFVEPDIYASHHGLVLLGAMPFRDLVLNVHIYCPERSPVTGDPTDLRACEDHVLVALAHDHRQRSLMSSHVQPGGPSWLLSEFGATQSAPLVASVVQEAADLSLGWLYWSWAYLDDPTGSSHEALVEHDGTLSPAIHGLVGPYPQVIAGTPLDDDENPLGGRLELLFATSSHATGPTVISVPRQRYPHGWCARVDGGSIISQAGSSHLVVQTSPGHELVHISVTPGRC